MSYGFLIFKPLVEIRSQNDLTETTVATLDPTEVMDGLSKLLPSLKWRRHPKDTRFRATHDADETWYEFAVSADPSQSWTINTSHHAGQRGVVARICQELGYVAFDGQSMIIIRPDGEIPAIANEKR